MKFRVCQFGNVRFVSLLFADDVVLFVSVVDVTSGRGFPHGSGSQSTKYPDLLNPDTNESLLTLFYYQKAIENIKVLIF